jgi:cytochrome d ubiquinol oxidase subunit II
MLTSAVFGVFPMVLPANSDPRWSLTVESASAPAHGLQIGLAWFVPGFVLAVCYFVFLYRKFAGKVKPGEGHY